MRLIPVSLIVALCAMQAVAIIRLCDNTVTTAGVYSTAQGAHDAAANGDTIYMVGSGGHYGPLISTRQLYWFGPGYFLAENNLNPTASSPAIFSAMTPNAGSEGSVFSGIMVSGHTTVNCSNIIFRRCRFDGSFNDYLIFLNSVNTIAFEQCYMLNVGGAYNVPVYHLNSSHNVVFRNCIITAVNFLPQFLSSGDAGPVEFTNCVLNMVVNVYGSTFTNCILTDGTFSWNNCGVTYSMSYNNAFGSLNGNVSNVNMGTVFLGVPTTSDGYYRLAANSPAAGAGAGGTDMGPYGGANPYVLSGIPPIPYLRLINAPISGTSVNGLPVTIEVQGRN